MKSIEQTILEIYKKECLRDYFDEDFANIDIHKDYILENLNTHDPKLLIKQLEKLDNFYKADLEEKEVVRLSCISRIVDTDKFKNLLDFYGYYLTKEEYDVDEEKYAYYICPKYSKNCSEFIYRECQGVCYHICLTDNVESILKTGLRCKKSNYRYFPERIYVIGIPIKNIKDFSSILRDVVDEMIIKDISRYSVLKINKTRRSKSEIGPDFYQDDAMDQPNTFFTYTNIPPKEIKNIGKLNKFIK